jgi:hypothetical protein
VPGGATAAAGGRPGKPNSSRSRSPSSRSGGRLAYTESSSMLENLLH